MACDCRLSYQALEKCAGNANVVCVWAHEPYMLLVFAMLA